MKRWIVAGALALAVVSFFARHGPGPAIQVNVHCGLEYPRIEFDGKLWRFDTEGRSNRAAAWDTGLGVTMHIRPGADGRPVVTDPDGGEWTLVSTYDVPYGCV